MPKNHDKVVNICTHIQYYASEGARKAYTQPSMDQLYHNKKNMTGSTKPIKKQYSIKQMKDLLFKHGGNLTQISKEIAYSRHAIYRYIEEFHELIEAREAADKDVAGMELESAYTVFQKLIEKVDEDPSNAFKSAQLVATRSKKSRYHDDKNSDSSGVDTLAHLSELSKRNMEQEIKIAQLEAKIAGSK